MSHGKQFTLYSNETGANGWKVAIVLNELGLSYHTIYLDLRTREQKSSEHVQYNPNGRIPTLIDHYNDDYTIWESNAIILYLIEKYDKERRLTVEEEEEKYQLLQWMFFQASGQGPYFGQAGWFLMFHSEKLPSAIERYQREALRVFGVLDGVLKSREWLVGNKLTIADLAFVTWNDTVVWLNVLETFPEKVDLPTQFPAFWAWHEKLMALESVKAAHALRYSLTAERRAGSRTTGEQ